MTEQIYDIFMMFQNSYKEMILFQSWKKMFPELNDA